MTEVKAPIKNATVVQAYPKTGSTIKKISKANNIITIPMYLYSAAKNAAAPLSMWDAISNRS